MADSGSTLKAPLKTRVEELGVLDQIAHLGKQFTEEEKKEYFDSLPGKKYKVGLIRNKDLDITIKIFTESFDFSKKLNAKLAGVDTFVSKECRGGELTTEAAAAAEEEEVLEIPDGSVSSAAVSVATPEREEENDASVGTLNSGSTAANTNNSYSETSESTDSTSTMRGGADDPYGEVPESASAPYENSENLDAIPLNGFNRTANTPEKELVVPPETIGTSSDFERLYLGWMNDPELALTDEDKQKRKNSMKSLFRFIFGTKNISDVTATTLQKKLRLAYTPLTHAEKLPCEDSIGGAWEDFRASLVYRRKLAMCELFAARDVLGDEWRMYIERKKEIALGLRDLIDVLDRQVYPCMLYAYDGSQHEEDLSDLMADDEFSRILQVFRTFVKDKKEGRKFYSLLTLKKELSKKISGTPKETASALYAELLALLTWMAGEAEATQKIQGLEKNLGRMRNIATQQKENIEVLENLVLLLTVVLAMSEKIHKLILALAELKCQVEKCCNHKRAEKLARAAAVKNADIQTLEQEIQKSKEEYGAMTNKLQKTIGQQTDDIQELEELILALTQLLINMDKLHTINMSLTELRAALKDCYEKQKQVKVYQAQLNSLKKVLLRKDQNAQTLAAQTMVDQGVQFANTAGSELEKQIAELEQRIKTLIAEDMKKGKKIEMLEVKVSELEEVILLLTQVLVEAEKINATKMSLSELKSAVEDCCEKKKRVDAYTEKLQELKSELLRKDQNTETLAAQAKVDQGIMVGNDAASELDKTIAELELRIKTLVAEDVKKGERIDSLENESAEKSVIIKELEEATSALMAVIVGIKNTHDIERELSALKAALLLCCERKKKARECKEQLERLEAQIRMLIQKEGATKELEEALKTSRESQQKADEAGAALKGQLDGLRSELEEVVGSSKKQLDGLRDELRGEVDKETSHATELAARVAELEAQILGAQAAINEATEGRVAAEAALKAAANTSAAEAAAKEKLKKNLNAARAGYEADLADAAAAREAAAAEAEARTAAAEEELVAARAAVDAVRKELTAARTAAAADREDLEAQLGLARLEVEVTTEDAEARIAAAAAASAAALSRAADAEMNRAAVAGQRNKLAANLKASQEATTAAGAVLEDIIRERDRANRELSAATIELGATRANRNSAKNALEDLNKEMERQSAAAAESVAAAAAAVAAARAEAETAAGASFAERDMIAAELAKRVADHGRALSEQAEKEAELARLQAANAGLAGQLAAVSEGAEAASAAAQAAIAKLEGNSVTDKKELEAKKAELLAVEDTARKAVDAAVEEHKKKIAELIVAQEKQLDAVKQAADNATKEAAEHNAEQEIEVDSLRRKSEALAQELAATQTAAKGIATSAASQIDFLTRRIEQLQGESLDKDRRISHLEGQAHELRAGAEEKKSIWNRLSAPAPLRAATAKPAWVSPSGRGEYTGRAAMGVGRGLGGTGASTVGARGSAQRGGGTTPKKSFCDTMLSLLLLELTENEDTSPEQFLKKAGMTIDELGQCPLVLRALSEIVDETLNQEVPEDGYLFSHARVSNGAFAQELEEAYSKIFSEAEKTALLQSAPPIIYYSKSPEEFEGILGDKPYFLNGDPVEKGSDVRLRGVDLDTDEDPIVMTGDERDLVEKGGVPLGAIIFLYLTCVKDMEDDEGVASELPALRSPAT